MRRKLLDGTVVRFLLVGVINTLVGCGAMFLLYNLAHWSYWLSSAANYVLGGVVSFFLNKYFTFRKREWSWKQAGRFAINVAVCWLLAYKAAGAGGAGGPARLAPGEWGHGGGHVSVHGAELPGSAVFCLSEVTFALLKESWYNKTIRLRFSALWAGDGEAAPGEAAGAENKD